MASACGLTFTSSQVAEAKVANLPGVPQFDGQSGWSDSDCARMRAYLGQGAAAGDATAAAVLQSVSMPAQTQVVASTPAQAALHVDAQLGGATAVPVAISAGPVPVATTSQAGTVAAACAGNLCSNATAAAKASTNLVQSQTAALNTVSALPQTAKSTAVNGVQSGASTTAPATLAGKLSAFASTATGKIVLALIAVMAIKKIRG
jgi:hypothetical protein